MLRFVTHITLILLFFSLAAAGTAARSNNPGPAQDAAATAQRTIRARSGDTLKKVAQRLGVPLAELVRLNGFAESAPLRKGMKIVLPADAAGSSIEAGEVIGKRITLSDGYSLEVDEVWKDGDEIWYRKGNISARLQNAVSSVKPIIKAAAPAPAGTGQVATVVRPKSLAEKPSAPVWIYLVGGARFRVDEVQETSDGAWYSRNNLSIFLERERIARIERDQPDSTGPGGLGRDWTSGNPLIDQLIKTNGTRFGVDPYLVFLVIEQESHFHPRALSPKGARGLMQLMPGTAARYGVRRPFEPEENIRGGTQYLKELMGMFGGRVDLVLASYNAGEGAVVKFGRTVPPYRETEDYVKRISKRYKAGAPTEMKSEAPNSPSRP
jgi:soluble lytic murein transglycosylase-like protein